MKLTGGDKTSIVEFGFTSLHGGVSCARWAALAEVWRPQSLKHEAGETREKQRCDRVGRRRTGGMWEGMVVKHRKPARAWAALPLSWGRRGEGQSNREPSRTTEQVNALIKRCVRKTTGQAVCQMALRQVEARTATGRLSQQYRRGCCGVHLSQGSRGEEEGTGKRAVRTALALGTYFLPGLLHTSYNLILKITCDGSTALCDG